MKPERERRKTEGDGEKDWTENCPGCPPADIIYRQSRSKFMKHCLKVCSGYAVIVSAVEREDVEMEERLVGWMEVPVGIGPLSWDVLVSVGLC